MIQIQGLYPAKTGLIYDSPQLHITFHGIPNGEIAVDVAVVNADGVTTGQMVLQIKRAELVYTANPDPYEGLLQAIQQNIILQLQNDNSHNAQFSIM